MTTPEFAGHIDLPYSLSLELRLLIEYLSTFEVIRYSASADAKLCNRKLTAAHVDHAIVEISCGWLPYHHSLPLLPDY